MSVPKYASQSDATSCISSCKVMNSIKETEVDHIFLREQGMHLYGYCYPGPNGVFGEWNGKSHALATDGLELQLPVNSFNLGASNRQWIFGVLYPRHSGCIHSLQSLPRALINFDGQYFAQPFHYPSPVSPQSLISSGIFPHQTTYGPELLPLHPWVPLVFVQDRLQGSMLINTISHANPSFESPKFTGSRSLQVSKTKEEVKGFFLAPAVTQTPATNKIMSRVSLATAMPKVYAPKNKFPLYHNQAKGGLLYPKNPASMKETNPNECLGLEKDGNSSKLVAEVKRDLYNLSDFPTNYEHALFFVIKSYSEDDIHKSIKYNVWTSTPNGNKRLKSAFQATQIEMTETDSKCPIFLFFSVNASGQFCGVAEMTVQVDFSKNMDFWHQDKWNGFFPMKWHIIKDIPNPQLRHILLENNDYKPVTNSRDTQEVKFPQGTEMLNNSKTCILDDFGFYENRQRVMQAKRNKSLGLSLIYTSPKTYELTQGQRTSNPNSESTTEEAVDLSTDKTLEEPLPVV